MVQFIAEVSSKPCPGPEPGPCAFVDCAADSGFDAVKFQLFRVAQPFAPEILEKSPQHRKACRLGIAAAGTIWSRSARCRERNIAFSCTPFYLEAVKQLEPYVAFCKIRSYELLWTDRLKACAATASR